MGGCGSREKELRERLCLPQSEFDMAMKKFTKMTKVKPGKSDEYFSFEGFKQYFVENSVFAQKLYSFMRAQSEQNYIDVKTYFAIINLFARVSMKLEGNFKELEVYILFILVSLQSPDILSKKAPSINNIYKNSINYSNAIKLFKELINMQSSKGEILCNDDDQAPVLIANSIFENHSVMNFKTFADKIKVEISQIDRIIKNYFGGKFMNKNLRNTIPQFDSSYLLNRQYIAMLNLNIQWLQKCEELTLVYKYEVEGSGPYNFNVLGNALLTAKGPVIMLFRHSQLDKEGENEQKYIFGYFTTSQWKVSPDISGNKHSFVFSICPKFKIFSTNGQQQSKFAILVPIKTKKSSQQLSSPLVGGPKQPGLGIGGSGYEQHRIWIDGKQLQASRIVEEDKTFQPGPLLPSDIHLLNIDTIEIWKLQFQNVGSSTNYFSSNNNKKSSFGEAEKQINQGELRQVMLQLNKQYGRNEYRKDTLEYQHTPLLPINEEEEEKQQVK